MPASRSRTLEWRRSLQQVFERGGAIEIALAHDPSPPVGAAGGDIIWRVRVLGLSETEIIVEQPSALGRAIDMDVGVALIGAIAIGQNRWLFRTEHLAATTVAIDQRRSARCMRLRMPDHVERSARRGLRVETAALHLPEMEIWPLLDPKSVVVAERRNEMQFQALLSGETSPAEGDQEQFLPTVGPKFHAALMNLGGGGVGIKVAPENAVQFSRHRIFWLRLALPPELPVPICVTGKVVHTHIDSAQCTYAGVQFDFTFNPAHEQLVGEQIRRAIMMRQELQRQVREQLDSDADRLAA